MEKVLMSTRRRGWGGGGTGETLDHSTWGEKERGFEGVIWRTMKPILGERDAKGWVATRKMLKTSGGCAKIGGERGSKEGRK